MTNPPAPRPSSPRAAPDLPLDPLVRGADEPLARQLARQLRDAVAGGRLTPGALLPSTRTLAATLGVTRGTVVEAYAQLDAEGYVTSRHGSGTRVRDGVGSAAPRPAAGVVSHRWLRDAPPLRRDGPSPSGLLDFRLGQPSVTDLDLSVWRRVWRDAARTAPPDDYGDPSGEPELRAALAGLVTRSRGLPAGADDVTVTSGSLQGLDLIARAVLRSGDTVVMESPGYRAARQTLEERGATVLDVGVDDDGLRVQDLPERGEAPLLLYCTPSHQYPLGVRMPVERRLALLAWAERRDVLIVEDDYDSEFRFGSPPLPTLASLGGASADGRVAYLGTLSKVLTPAVRLGYVVSPPALRTRLAREKALSDGGPPWVTQQAVTAFVAGGHLERHVRRARRRYARNRELLDLALRGLHPHATPLGISAGLHVCLDLHPPLVAEDVAREAARLGVGVRTLAGYGVEREAVLLGYGALTPQQVEWGARQVVRAVRRLLAVTGPSSPVEVNDVQSSTGFLSR